MKTNNSGIDKEPKIVVLGGGTGIPVLLRGLKNYTSNITAIITVTDDGGSSGRLRTEMGILPPGDIRNCLVALATAEPLMEKLFQYRFEGNCELAGHSFGNLFITALTETTGDFLEALRESSRILAVKGRVLPSTLENTVLGAQMTNGEVVWGETKIVASPRQIKRVFLKSETAGALPEAIEAIQNADGIVVGPGSLYTSVLPNLLIKEIGEALDKSQAPKIYICNIMTQHGETDGMTAAAHIEALYSHIGKALFTHTLLNMNGIKQDVLERYHAENAFIVLNDFAALKRLGLKLVVRDVLHQGEQVRHDSIKLARAVMEIVEGRYDS